MYVYPTLLLSLTVLAGNMFKEAGLEVRSVGIDEDGMRVDELDQLIRGAGIRPRLVYTIPFHHNPTGVCLSDERSQRLLSLAAEFDFVVVSDEPYTLINFDLSDPPDPHRPPAAPLPLTHAASGASAGGTSTGVHPHVLALMSFSKILTPGLRMGWVLGPSALVESLRREGVVASGGGPPSILSEVCRRLMDTQDLDRHVAAVAAELAARGRLLLALVARLREDAGLAAACRQPAGGYFVWLEFAPEAPPGFDTLALWTKAQASPPPPSPPPLPGTEWS
jgi:2-aminoadipate transaminase